MERKRYVAWWADGGEIEDFDTLEEAEEWLREVNTEQNHEGPEINLWADNCFIAEIKKRLVIEDQMFPPESRIVFEDLK